MSPCSRRSWLLTCLAAGLAPAAPAHAQYRREAWPAAQAAPPLRLPQLGGGERSMQQFGGQVLLLNFWASWCEPCVSELPSLLRLAEARAADGLAVCCVNYQEGEAKVRAFLDTVLGEVPASLSFLLDRDGAAARAWTGRIFPTTVAVDRAGRPRWRVAGELNWTGADAMGLLAPLLKAPR
jgi:thiol-disulfide isomerase/thioredoxin